MEMPIRWPIFVGIAAIAGGVAWFALREGDPSANRTQGSSELTPSKVPSRTPIAAPQQPSLGIDASIGSDGRPVLPPPLGIEAEFASQSRDDDWAPATETELKQRFKKIRGAKLQETECHQSSCRFVVAGSEADVSQTIADLESDRGLHSFAKNVLLTLPERKPDGSLVLRAFLLFDR